MSVDEFGFEDFKRRFGYGIVIRTTLQAERALDRGVVVRTSSGTHTLGDIMFLTVADKLKRAKLAPLI